MANQYFNCAVEGWRSGQTLYGRMHYWRTGSYYYQDTSFPDPTMNLGGTVFTDTDFGNRVRSGIYVGDVYTTTFSRTVAGSGDRTVTFTAGSGGRSDFAGSWSTVVNFPVQYTAPSTPTLSATIPASDPTGSVQITWGTSSFGNPSSGTVYLYGGTSASPTTQLLTKTTTGNSVFTHNEPLTPNTKYYYRARACNSQLCSSYTSDVSATTYPAAPSISVSALSYNSALLSISSPSQGSAETMEAFYTLDGGTAISTGTITSGGTNTASLTLTPGTAHTITAYIRTNAGTSSTASTSITTHLPFYGSVNGQSKEINKFYGSVNGVTKTIEHLYGAAPTNVLTSVTGTIEPGYAGNVTAFDGETFYNTIAQDPYLEEEIIHSGKTIVAVDYGIFNGIWDSLAYFSDNSQVIVGGTDLPIDDPADLGFTVSYVQDGYDMVNLTGTYDVQYFSKKIF